MKSLDILKEQRPTLVGLQIMRALAALIVVLYHTEKYLQKKGGVDSAFGIFQFGSAGVQIFFMISGYIIYYVHANDIGKKDRLNSYLWKRITRIYPPYLIVTAALIGTCFFRATCGADYHHSYVTVLLSILLIPENHSPYLGVAWTLTHEIFFYLIFSLLIVSKRIGLSLLSLWAAGTIYYALQEGFMKYPNFSENFPLSFIFSPINLFFLMGIMVAILQRRMRIALPHHAFTTGMFALFIFAYLIETKGPSLYATALLVTSGTLMLLSSGSIRPWAAITPILFIGNASYSIYLLHNPIFGALVPAARHFELMSQPEILGIVIFSIAIALGSLYYAFVERPLLSLLKNKKPAPRGIRRQHV